MTSYKHKICKYCKKNNEKIISLKHYFFKCNECNIIFREEKAKADSIRQWQRLRETQCACKLQSQFRRRELCKDYK